LRKKKGGTGDGRRIIAGETCGPSQAISLWSEEEIKRHDEVTEKVVAPSRVVRLGLGLGGENDVSFSLGGFTYLGIHPDVGRQGEAGRFAVRDDCFRVVGVQGVGRTRGTKISRMPRCLYEEEEQVGLDGGLDEVLRGH